MADWTAITGIVVSGVLGPAVVGWLADRRGRREHEYALVLSDRVELRQFLGEAEHALRFAERVASAFPGLLLTHGHWLPDRADTHIKTFYEAMREVDLRSSQLALRIGAAHEATLQYRQAFDSLARLTAAVQLLDPQRDDAESLRQANSDIRDGHAAAVAAHSRFLSSANSAWGVDSNPQRGGRRASRPRRRLFRRVVRSAT